MSKNKKKTHAHTMVGTLDVSREVEKMTGVPNDTQPNVT